MKRLFVLFLALAMILSTVPFGAFATETEPVLETQVVSETEPAQETEPVVETETFEIPFRVNPIYEGIYTQEDFLRSEPQTPTPEDDASEDGNFHQDNQLLYSANYLTVEKAAEVLRQYMVARTESFTLYFKGSTSDYEALLTDMLLLATEHTGKPQEGDYLLWHFGGWGGEVSRDSENGEYLFAFTAEMYYLTTAAQEKELDTAVSALLNTLGISGKSDYEKVKAVYDYICQNITYDYTNLEDDSYTLKHTAYAALINKTAVCQGYATLLYRVMLELGVDIRVITGVDHNGAAHAWNIVKLGSVYYNLDATWDAGYDEYYWFLCNSVNFPYHYRYMEYETTQFHTDYPMAAEDYVDGVEGVPEYYFLIGMCGDDVYWAIDRDRNLTIAGNGAMWDYASITSGSEAEYPPWYYWMDAFECVIVEEGVTTIGNNAFYNMSHITSVTLPNTLVEIGNFAFEYLSEVDIFALPSALETIGANAFSRCTKLTEITIPDSVKILGNGAFFNCSALEKVTFGENIESIGDRAFQQTKITEAILPDGVLTLGNYAFGSCTQLQKVELGSSLKTIGSNAFEYCRALSKITLPDTLTEIGAYAFFSSGLTEIGIPNSVTTLGNEVFRNCMVLQQVILSSSLTSIPSGTFKECYALKTLEIPKGITVIGANAFQQSGLIELALPESVATLEEGAFHDCNSLLRVQLNNGLQTIGNSVFNTCRNLADITIPDSVTSIGGWAFSGCSSLITAVIPAGVTSVSKSMFSQCENLSNVTIPAGVTDIGSNAFSGCVSLKSIVIPDGVTDIGSSAFYGCDGLKSIAVPSAVTSVGSNAFGYCNALEEIIFLGDAPAFAVDTLGNPVFSGTTATAYYPIGNETWTEDVLKDYGGTITWVAQCVSHEFSDVEVIAPTCTEGGYTRHSCPVCHQSYIADETKALGHDLPDWTITEAATCTTDGSKTCACQREGCDYSETEVIPAIGHSYAAVVTAPTCTAGGYTTSTCSICGDTAVTDEVPALGHSCTYTLVTAPTADAEGTLSAVCATCGETVTQVLPKLNKTDYTLTVLTEPTKEAEGLGRYTWNTTEYGEFSFEVTLDKLPEVILGDVNGDGEVTVLDLMRLANYFANGADINAANADVNADGAVTVLDLMRLANYFAGNATLG